jgi:CRISPR-associated protein Csb1
VSTASKLTLTALEAAVAGSGAAFRLTLRLESVSPKVFPPTYEGGKYATEERIIGGQRLPCVLLDSVPSQANRMELALHDAWLGGGNRAASRVIRFCGAGKPWRPQGVEPASASSHRRCDLA